MLPNCKGSYILLLFLSNDMKVKSKAKEWFLANGYYIYIGSAKGKGGIKGRVMRYLNPNKKKHWHIDYLLPYAMIIRIFVLCEVEEKELVKRLSMMFDPVVGFGSSDNRNAKGHLLKIKREKV